MAKKGNKDVDTIVEDKMGNIHIWEGQCDIIQVSKYEWKCKMGKELKEADEFVQFDTDEWKKDNLTPEEIEDLEAGWTIHKKVLGD